MNKLRLAAAAAALLAAGAGHAAVSVTSPSFTYGQNFDSLATTGTANAWANDSTLPGWSLFNFSSGPLGTYQAGTGSGNAGAFWSFGAAASSERALGGLGSGGAYFGSPANGSTAGYIALAFSNDSGAELAGFTIGFDGEQWRDGGAATPNAQTMVLQYGFGATFGGVAVWNTPGGSFNFTSPVFTNTGAGAAVVGNTAGLTAGLGGTVDASWAAGQTLWVRWVETNDFGNDHGLAIDNLTFSVSAVPEPGAWSLMLAGLAGVGFLARRRRA